MRRKDIIGTFALALFCSAIIARPAFAYVDPSVVTYTVQALAGVAVALSCVFGVAFRRFKKQIYKIFKIDENKDKVVDTFAIPTTDSKTLKEADEACKADMALTGSGKPQNKRWLPRFIIALIVCSAFVLTIGIFEPLELVLQDSFVFSFQNVLQPLIIIAVVLIIAGSLILSLVKGKAFNIIISIIFSISFLFVLQFLLMNKGLPTADGVPLHLFSAHNPIKVFGFSFIWIFIIAGLIVLARRSGKTLKQLAVVSSVALIIFQAVALGVNIQQVFARSEETLSGNSVVGRPYVSREGLDKISDKHNVIMFVLDTFDNTFFNRVQKDHPDVMNMFNGFTRFANVTGTNAPTRLAFAHLLTGKTLPDSADVYENKTLVDWYSNRNVVDEVADLGYSTEYYVTDIPQGLNSFAGGRVKNVKDNTNITADIIPTFLKLYNMALYRDSPWLLKPLFYFYTGDIDEGVMGQTQGDNAHFTLNDPKYDKTIKEKGLSVEKSGNSDKGSYRVIHLNGSHYPWIYNAKHEDVGEKKGSTYEQSYGALLIVNDYIDELKRLGKWDDTTFIITADHGEWRLDIPSNRTTTPFLFVKPAQSKELDDLPCKINNNPVSQFDLFPTILQEMGASKKETGAGLFQISNKPRTRVFLYPDSVNYNYLEWWEINGDANNINDWKLKKKVEIGTLTYG